MPQFTKGEIYGGMMKGFAQAFGDALTDIPTGKASEVAFGTTQTWAGVPFEFRHGATSDFPGASILIGGKAYYTALDSGKGTRKPFAGFFSGCH